MVFSFIKTFGVLAMRIVVFCLVAVLAVSTFHGSSSSTQSSVTVDLPGQGTILGAYGTTSWTNQTFMKFLGIPYAESPSRDLRFKHAVKKLPWRHVFDATTHGRRCPVITTIRELKETELSQDLEDCLNLCVYTKNLTDLKPVMFYIYGGGFYNGSNIDHPPNHLLEKDIVLVVPNYRVGALGWLSTRTENMPGNAPISDLYVALQWVQDYIHLFGGDPKQVTIFGQSAGTTMSGSLLFSPKTPETYFQRSIQQSGSIFSSWAITRNPMEQAERICNAVGCKFCENIDLLYVCLRNVTVPKILEVTEQESFSPIIGDFYGILPREPAELIAELNRSIPLMTGFTKHDGSFVLASVYDGVKAAIGNFSYITVRQFTNIIMDMAKDNTGLANNLLFKMLFTNELLQSTDHKKALPAYFDLTNIVSMKSPVITLATRMLQKALAPVYLYSFDYEGSNTRFGYEFGNEHYPFEGGVHHSNDNIYLFSTHKLNEADTKVAKNMVQLWTSFAITGKPSLENNMEILPMKDEDGPYFHINSDVTNDYDVLKELTVTIDDPENYKLDRPNIEF
ncbi:glutactin [Musca vetustissima]|uniref:glutactin n=1 Tax=Musca vetustissima TaxID=27455 RepID=UPI002AB7BEF0|nr:glutactin [Musca vetustissima]